MRGLQPCSPATDSTLSPQAAHDDSAACIDARGSPPIAPAQSATQGDRGVAVAGARLCTHVGHRVNGSDCATQYS
jgi:hypothetical protein